MNLTEGTGREKEIYAARFSAAENTLREACWRVLCSDFFQPFIRPEDTVVDLGAGDGLFLRNIHAARRVAVDLSEHARGLREFGIQVVQVSATEFTREFSDKTDVIFASNFFEHLPDKRSVVLVLEECRRSLKPGGLILILQPNIRYAGAAYWDFLDHHIALTDRSLVEALRATGYEVVRVIPRFMPYTSKLTFWQVLPAGLISVLMKIYLHCPFLWRWFGQQSFIAARTSQAELP